MKYSSITLKLNDFCLASQQSSLFCTLPLHKLILFLQQLQFFKVFCLVVSLQAFFHP